MKPRDRVFAALEHRVPDRVPRFEIWIDACLEELGQSDGPSAYANLGQDCILMTSETLPGSNAWGTGVDEWGRVWKDGMYVDGVVETEADLARYSLPVERSVQFFDPSKIADVKVRFPDHCLTYGSHHGPFTAGYMAMGFERFFYQLLDNPEFVHKLFHERTQWCIALFRRAASLGADVLILGDDAGHREGPMISPRMWREFVLPYHKQIVEAVNVPVIWHSDGNVTSLLPMAVEAGFVGFHGLEPAAGMDLGEIKQEFGSRLALIGNVDVSTLCGHDLSAVRKEVDRCIEQGAPGGGFMIASCNSIFEGMNPAAVAEMFRYQSEVGAYP